MVAERQHIGNLCKLSKNMENNKYTDQLAAMKPLCRNEFTNKLTDRYKLSVDCRILRIVEFDLKLLLFKKPTI